MTTTPDGVPAPEPEPTPNAEAAPDAEALAQGDETSVPGAGPAADDAQVIGAVQVSKVAPVPDAAPAAAPAAAAAPASSEALDATPAPGADATPAPGADATPAPGPAPAAVPDATPAADGVPATAALATQAGEGEPTFEVASLSGAEGEIRTSGGAPEPGNESATGGNPPAGDEPPPGDKPTPANRRFPRRRAVVAAFALGIVAVAAVVGAGVYGYDQAHIGLVMPGVRVGSVDLSNHSREAATARLREAFASQAQGTIVLSDGSTSEAIPFAEFGRRPDVEALLDRAFAVGRTGTPFERAIDEIRAAVRGVTIDPAVRMDTVAVQRSVAAIAAREDRVAVDATALATTSGFTTTAAAVGLAIDQVASRAAIITALGDPSAPAEIRVVLPTKVVEPAVSDGMANDARAWAAVMDQDLVVAAGKETWTLDAAAIRSWTRFGLIDGRYAPSVDVSRLKSALAPFAPKITRSAKDAVFLVGKGGLVVGVTAAIEGRTLDLDGTVNTVAAALAGRAIGGLPSNGTVPAALILTEPKLTTDVAQQSAPLMRPISSWTTYYIPGSHNGFGANISIPALTISGTVVAPGEWFSFWKTVGEVTLAKGYTLGGAIIDGRSVEGKTIGGGICSCSTTLFNAALRAGFEMGARKNHYYYISRYPMGLDATVFINDAGTAQDMTWRNDTSYPVLIKASAKPGVVKFTLYSVPNGRQVTLTTPIVKNYKPSQTIIQETTNLKPGQKLQVEYEAAGFDAWVTRIVRDASGAIVHQETYFSHYARVVGIVLVGQQTPA